MTSRGGKRFFRIYLYPLFVVPACFVPWYLFIRFVLKREVYELFGPGTRPEAIKIYFLVVVPSLFYIFWVWLQVRREKALDEKAKEEVSLKFFLGWGRFMGLMVAIQGAIVILMLLLLV